MGDRIGRDSARVSPPRTNRLSYEGDSRNRPRAGHRIAQLTILIGNLAAQRAYEKAGFTVRDEKATSQLRAALGALASCEWYGILIVRISRSGRRTRHVDDGASVRSRRIALKQITDYHPASKSFSLATRLPRPCRNLMGAMKGLEGRAPKMLAASMAAMPPELRRRPAHR